MIMAFYSFLSFFLGPLIGFNIKKNKEGITHGMIVGTIISIFLWYSYGSKMITIQ